MSRNADAKKALGSTYDALHEAKVLLIGAGGLGCELLKDIVLLGFAEIHVVDLDTIDLSNLNRQFLFSRESIKKPKALVAKESASKFNPEVKIVAHHANIKDKQFDIPWFQSFKIIFNALDNLDARRYVNRTCLSANVPLIESGTAGFNGQVQVILPGKSECYDCNPKPVTKTFAICTIRSTPSLPIHCVVWAKNYLFSYVNALAMLSSRSNIVNCSVLRTLRLLIIAKIVIMVSNGRLYWGVIFRKITTNSADEIKNLQREANELKQVKAAINTPEFARQAFDKVFHTDIERLVSMDSMWKTRKAPKALDFDTIEAQITDPNSLVNALSNDQAVWSLQENFSVFKDSLARLEKRLAEQLKQNSDLEPVLEFDKDDEDTLDFVVASANIRSYIFSIEQKSKFDIKREYMTLVGGSYFCSNLEIAGNIIPAIATTNAIVAGLCVMQSLKLLAGTPEKARGVFLSQLPGYKFNSQALHPPNPQCVVCGVTRAVLKTNLEATTVRDIVENLLHQQWKYGEDVSLMTDSLIYDPDFDDNLDRSLTSLGFTDGSFLTVVDDNDQPRANLELYVLAGADKFDTINAPDFRTKPEPETNIHDEDLSVEDHGIKRKLEDGNEEGPFKKRKEDDGGHGIVEIDDEDVVEIDDDDVVEIDDDDDNVELLISNGNS